MKVTSIVLSMVAMNLSGCGHDAEKSAALIRDPPIKELKSDKLRELVKTCQTYPATQGSRGPYDAAYCKSAIDAWNNVPLQAAGISRPVLMADPSKQ